MNRRRAKPNAPPSEAAQVAIAAQILEVMAHRHRVAGDGFKRSSDEEAAQIEYGFAEKLEDALRILRQHRLLPPSVLHAQAHRAGGRA